MKTTMTITLTPEQEAWLKARVARGEYSAIEEAARQLIAEGIAERATEESDDLAWAKPYIDEALADVERGDVITREDHEARIEAHLSFQSKRSGQWRAPWKTASNSARSSLSR